MSAERAPEPATARRVLVVEDEPELRDVVCVVLEDEGYVVVAASDGQKGVDMCCDQLPDLIILDMGLPILSGEEVASTLREKLAEVPPILVMSAAGTVAERARRIGAANYVPKPFELDDLINAVHKLLD